MAKFFLLVELKKRDLKHKCAVTNVNWNNLTLEFLAKDEQNLLGTTSNYLRSSQGTIRNFRTFQGLCDITKHEIYKIGHISAIFKDRDFWFGPKNSINLCAEHYTSIGVIKCISGHVTAHLRFFYRGTFTVRVDYLKIHILHSF